MKNISSIRGMRDILPPESECWRQVMQTIGKTLHSYGYAPAYFPLLEKTALFARSIGEITDIIEKEMYTFSDRNDESISLRPEATAGIVRAMIEHGLLQQVHKLWTYGPMFRYERPQKGRYRQFYQVSVEAFGMKDAALDAELIALAARMWRSLGFYDQVRLEINTLGLLDERKHFRDALVDYFSAHSAELDEDSQRRLLNNPLRILDSKNEAMRGLIDNAPKIRDYLSQESLEYYEKILAYLRDMGIEYYENPCLVRGLDYYCHSVFEWVTDQLGAQGTICAGGRYDGLVSQLGGQPTPAAGFAIGIDRVIALLQNEKREESSPPFVFAIALDDQAKSFLLRLCERLREALPDKKIICYHGGQSLKNQLKKADQSRARYALIVGEEERMQQRVQIKDLYRGESLSLSEQACMDYMIESSNLSE